MGRYAVSLAFHHETNAGNCSNLERAEERESAESRGLLKASTSVIACHLKSSISISQVAFGDFTIPSFSSSIRVENTFL